MSSYGGEGPPCPIRWDPLGDGRGEPDVFFESLFCLVYTQKPTHRPSERPFCVPVGKLEAISPWQRTPHNSSQQLVYSNAPFLFLFFNTFRVKDFFFLLLSSFLIFYIFILFKPHALSVFNNHQDFLLLLFSNNKTPQFHPAPSLGRLANNFYKPTLLTYISFSFRWSIHFDCNNKKKPVGQGSIDWGLSQNKNNKKTCRGTKKNNERVEIDTIPGGR